MKIPEFTLWQTRNINLIEAKELADAIYAEIENVESTVTGFLSLHPQLKKDLPKIKKLIKKHFDDAKIEFEIYYWYDSGDRALQVNITTKSKKDKKNLVNDLHENNISREYLIIKLTNKKGE